MFGILKKQLGGGQKCFSGKADYIVKKIQTEGKWDSARQRVAEFKESDRQTTEIFVEDVEHGYTRELGPILIGDTFWNRLNFPSDFDKIKMHCKLQTFAGKTQPRLIEKTKALGKWRASQRKHCPNM